MVSLRVTWKSSNVVTMKLRKMYEHTKILNNVEIFQIQRLKSCFKELNHFFRGFVMLISSSLVNVALGSYLALFLRIRA